MTTCRRVGCHAQALCQSCWRQMWPVGVLTSRPSTWSLTTTFPLLRATTCTELAEQPGQGGRCDHLFPNSARCDARVRCCATGPFKQFDLQSCNG